MTNYKIFNAKEFVAAGAGTSGSLDRAWGVMRGTAVCSGSVTLEGVVDNNVSGTFAQTNNHSTIKLEYLAVGEPIPCYVRSITVTAGSAYLLA
jgi:hypothetical protein